VIASGLSFETSANPFIAVLGTKTSERRLNFSQA
jgi:fucose permease